MSDITITTDNRVIANIEAGISCPDCGNHNCSEYEQDTIICRECGYVGSHNEFKSGESDKHVSDRCHACDRDCPAVFPNCPYGGFVLAQEAGNAAWEKAEPGNRFDAYKEAFDAAIPAF